MAYLLNIGAALPQGIVNAQALADQAHQRVAAAQRAARPEDAMQDLIAAVQLLARSNQALTHDLLTEQTGPVRR